MVRYAALRDLVDSQAERVSQLLRDGLPLPSLLLLRCYSRVASIIQRQRYLFYRVLLCNEPRRAPRAKAAL